MRENLWITKVLIISVLLSILLPCHVSAQWVPDGAPVCTASQDQTLQQMISDGSDGAIIVWQDLRSGSFWDIYAQRINADGYPLWISDGIPICDHESSNYQPQIVPDGAGGSIIVWSDNRNGDYEIWGQRIDGSGTDLWAEDGVRVSEIFENASKPQITSDGVGGAIVSYTVSDISSPPYGVYVKSIDPNGNPRCCDAGLSSGEVHQIISDGAGGAIITWSEFVDDFGGSWDIRAQRVDTAGSTYWGTGVSVAYGWTDQYDPQIVSDGSGGAIITWVNQTAWHIYAQRIDPDGNALWTPATGVEVCTYWANQTYPHLTTDGAGGAIIAWQDKRHGPWWSVYAQNVDAIGNLSWNPDGIAISTVAGDQQSIQLSTNGYGGAVITWEDHRAEPNQGIYAQRVNVGGEVFWTTDGVAICTATGDQIIPQLISTCNGGAIVSWMDPRDGDNDIYAQGFCADPCLVAPADIDFGMVTIGSYQETVFEITNTTENGTLSGTVSESCDHYSIESGGGAYSLAPGESRLVTVRFEPGSVGTHLCTIQTGDALCTDVSCTGVGGCLTGTIYVNTNATGAGDGTSWGNAFTELRDALWVAGICDDVTEIWVAEGTYTPTAGTLRSATFALKDTLALYGGFAGTETLLSERDIASNPTVLSGEIGTAGTADNSYHVITGSGTDPTAILDGFTITGGNANGEGVSEVRQGGGIYVSNGSPTVANSIFMDNSANSSGGGMFNVLGSSPFLTDIAFIGNSSSLGSGGGITNASNSNPTLINVIFDGNIARNGGGGMSNNSSDPILNNVVFIGNSAPLGSGGGISNNSSSPILTNVTLSNNTAQYNGGGMRNWVSCYPVVTNTIFSSNSAPSNPEIYNVSSVPVISYSLILGSGGSGAGWDPSFGTDGGNNIDADPQFKGAYCPDSPLAVWSSSPALDAGDNTAVPAWVTTDIDGDPRIYGGVVDMGAYEHQGPGTGVDDIPQAPKAFALYQNVPNPFNPVTTIRFDLPKAVHVKLSVYNVKGELVSAMIDQHMTEGRKEVSWTAIDNRGRSVASGVYFYHLVAGNFVQTKKMVLLR